MMHFFFCMILSVVMMVLSLVLSLNKYLNMRETQSVFECGFDPKSEARLPFSLNFFLVTILFLIFDVEIVLLLPFFFSMKMMFFSGWSQFHIFFFSVLILSTLMEWADNSIEWSF